MKSRENEYLVLFLVFWFVRRRMSSCQTRKSYPSVDSDRWQFLSLSLLIGFLKVVKVFIHYFVSLGGFFYVVNLSIPYQCVIRLSLLLFKKNLASIAS